MPNLKDYVHHGDTKCRCMESFNKQANGIQLPERE